MVKDGYITANYHFSGINFVINAITPSEPAQTINEYNFEVYTINPETKETGWDIKFVSVIAENKVQAKAILRDWPLFDCIILSNFCVPLPYDGNLATLSDTRKAGKGWVLDTDAYRSGKYKEVLFTHPTIK
jgi:hypothetical protein